MYPFTGWHGLPGHWIHSWLHVQDWSLNKHKTDVNVIGANHETDKSIFEGCSDHIQHLSHWFSHTDTNPCAIFQIQLGSLPVLLGWELSLCSCLQSALKQPSSISLSALWSISDSSLVQSVLKYNDFAT